MPPKKKAAADSDDEKPKRAPTPLALFKEDNMEKVKKDNAGKKQNEINKILSQMFKDADDDVKEKYTKKSKKLKAELEGDDDEEEEEKTTTKGSKKRGAPKKSDEEKTTTSDKPKRAQSALQIFQAAKLEETKNKKENEGKKPAELKKILSEMWKEMDDDEKKPYVDLSNQQKEQNKAAKKSSAPPKKKKKKDESEDEEGSESDEE
ncbi:hypothetical protein NAEGRDRAFT_57921 [Naegleria gruberi]|uniref:HMG box domain-containing protein n=1 Tax=Naegleria gruberi TaxID=5762 RepID=D2VE12_NAEGR|nr:uncharacterized protein NAEGRDRAFT_57921 [Naegleria gruberi]EFC44997.1 hypothetical protein NAEGRDRAFT_57921 [Naegleria gruberi]|eukprot:XP_002677741.1 hypothetical protein NAEGRDRAFT_57921 [Naegleria gruberi strain NEG-M]